MTALDRDIFDDDAQPRSRIAELLSRWPILPCAFIALMFMLATNDLNATARWETTTKEQVSQLAVNLESGREARQIGFLLLAGMGAIAIAVTKRRFRMDPLFFIPLALLLGWCVLSVLWSQDRSITVKRLVVMTCIGTAVIAFVKRYKVRDLALLALIGGTIQLCASLYFDLVYATGNYGLSGYRFSGLQHPNHSGISSVLLIFSSLYFFDRTRMRRFLLLTLFGVAILFLTKSRSSLFAGLAGLALFGALRWSPRILVTLAVGGGTMAGGLLLLVAAGILPQDWANIIHMGREDSQAAALTGRPQIWSAALEVFGNDYTRLLTGVGYDSFWTATTAEFVSNRVWFRISEGHNAYFDTMLEIGVIGVSCYLFLLLGSLYRWTRLAWVNHVGAYAFAAAIFAFAFVHGLTESTTVDPNFMTFISFTAITFLALRSPRMNQEADEGAA